MRYQIWNGTDDVYTPDGTHFTADQWREQWPWINIPGAKMIISTGPINGAVAMEFEQTKSVYKQSGANITDDMTDDEVLSAIEYFENHPVITEVSATERIAAALEAQVMMAEDDIEDTTETVEATPAMQTFAMRGVAAPMAASAIDGVSEVAAVADTVEEDTPQYIRARNNYQRGLWSDNLVKMAVRKGHITKADYQRITGKTYA